jgi:outer membrane protein assembly factor BamB
VEMSHVWTSTGAWAVTAQAKDTGNALSDWSTPSNIVISLLKWRIRISPGGYLPQLSSPAIGSGGTIYVGSVDSSLYAVNPDGSIKWCAHSGIISGIMQSSPAVGMDGTVYFRDDYCLYALTPDESLSTNIVLRQQVMSSISIDAHDWAYVVTRVKIMSTGEFWFYNLDDGWAAPAFGVDGTVYLLLRNAGVIAYDPVPNPDPTIKWQYSAGGLNPTDPAIGGDGTVYFGMENCLGADFIALSSDGTLRWTYLAGNAVRSSPAIDVDGTVYFGASDNYLYAFTSDGTLKWRFETGGDVNTSPALAADGTIYFGSDDSCLYAVNTDGTMKWRYSTGGPVESSPTIGSDGTVYFSSGDGYLYALDCRSPMANAPWPKYHHDLRNTACYGATN